jgi:hypothetical protein
MMPDHRHSIEQFEFHMELIFGYQLLAPLTPLRETEGGEIGGGMSVLQRQFMPLHRGL